MSGADPTSGLKAATRPDARPYDTKSACVTGTRSTLDDQQQFHTHLQSLPLALHWHCAQRSVQPSGGIGLSGLIPQLPTPAQAGSGAALESRTAQTTRASTTAKLRARRMTVSSSCSVI